MPEGAAAILGTRRRRVRVLRRGSRRLCMRAPRAGGRDPADRLPAVPARRPARCARTFASRSRTSARRQPSCCCPVLRSAALEVVPRRRRCRSTARLEGLDAREALPPLLRAGNADGLEGYERVGTHARSGSSRAAATAAQAIERIAAATDRCSRGVPAATPLATASTREFDIAPAPDDDEDLDAADDARRAGRRVGARGLVAPGACRGIRPHVARGRRRGGRRLSASSRRIWPRASSATGSPTTGRACTRSSSICASAWRCSRWRLPGTRRDRSTSAASPWQTVTKAIRNADLLLVHLSDPTDWPGALS